MTCQTEHTASNSLGFGDACTMPCPLAGLKSQVVQRLMNTRSPEFQQGLYTRTMQDFSRYRLPQLRDMLRARGEDSSGEWLLPAQGAAQLIFNFPVPGRCHAAKLPCPS